MRILYITDGFPYPLTSGYLRHYYFLKGLSQHHEIVLVSLVDPGFKEEHIQGVSPYTKQVITIVQQGKKSRSIRQRIVKRLRTLLGINQAILELQGILQTLLSEEKFDLVFLSGEYTYLALKNLSTPPILTDMCDAISYRVRGWILHASPLRKIALWIKYWELARIEQQTIRRSEYVLFASRRDLVVAPKETRAKAIILPNGVDTGYWQRQSKQLGDNTIIFTGAMHYPPNRDAALHLIDEILPLVKEKIEDVEVFIVGHSPADDLVAAGNKSGVHVTGFVEDMRVYLEKATLFVSPLRFGSGIQNKVLEAMAMALPVVTSSVAADGLVSREGEFPPVFLADDAQLFAELIIQQLQNRSSKPLPMSAARDYVEKNFSWDTNVKRLNELLQTIVSEK